MLIYVFYIFKSGLSVAVQSDMCLDLPLLVDVEDIIVMKPCSYMQRKYKSYSKNIHSELGLGDFDFRIFPPNHIQRPFKSGFSMGQ